MAELKTIKNNLNVKKFPEKIEPETKHAGYFTLMEWMEGITGSAPAIMLCIFMAAAGTGAAQVVNNDIEARFQLHADSLPVSSNTFDATVEWECIDKALTNKCLVYHNDQWFYFTVSQPGKYYLNISRQVCRDRRGLQVILIEGNPCEVATYRIKRCIDRIPQDDVFVALDSLQPGVPYLVNIDGFLNDFCEFTIALSSRAGGLPYAMTNLDTLDVTVTQAGEGIVRLAWQAGRGHTERLRGFDVYRSGSKDTRFTYVGYVPVRRNAYGTLLTQYEVADTLTGYGAYEYRIAGLYEAGPPGILSQRRIYFSEKAALPVADEHIKITPDFRNRSVIDVFVYDPVTEQLLHRFFHTVNRRGQNTISIRLTSHIKKGTYRFLVRLVDRRTQEIQEFRYKLDAHGRVVAH